MRKIAGVFIVFALMGSTGFAQENSEHLEHLRAMMHAMSQHGAVIPQPETINTQAATMINMTAFTNGRTASFTPNDFSVNQGDVVTVNVTVPSNDASPANPAHILLMGTYIE